MLLPHLNAALRRTTALALAIFMLLPSWAQEAQQTAQPAASQPPQTPQPQQFVLKDYSKPRSHFPNPIGPYMPRYVEPPTLSNTPRIEDLLHDGKLYLSLNDAVALALENNLDIAIQRYNMEIADTDILRTKAGASFLGVNSGLVQGTPGGGTGGLSGTIGSGTGGTAAGAGGAGAGAGGLVTSTLGSGPQITSFDPILTGTLQWDHSRTESSSSFANPFTTQNTFTGDFGYTQGFATGTALNMGFNNLRQTTSSQFSKFSPLLNSSFRATVTQHLLQGLGFAPNRRFIRIAQNNREISDVAFRLQTITTVDQIENIYWDLVFAYENVRVQKESLAFAQKTLSDNKKQVEIGTLAPIEVVRAQSTVATDQQQLTVAQTNLQLQQLLMKNALSRTLVDPKLADAEVIPTSTMQLPAQEPVTPIEELVNDAQFIASVARFVRILWRLWPWGRAESRQLLWSEWTPVRLLARRQCSPGRLRKHSQPTRKQHPARQRHGAPAQHPHPQPRLPSHADSFRARIPPSADAHSTTREPGSHRGPQRPVCGTAESRRRGIGAGGRGTWTPVARCRAEKVRARRFYHHPRPPKSNNTGSG